MGYNARLRYNPFINVEVSLPVGFNVKEMKRNFTVLKEKRVKSDVPLSPHTCK